MIARELSAPRRPQGPPRLKDVASKVGMSTATVSRALTGRGPVSPGTKRRIEAAAKELGFVASYHASSLASGRSRNIGVVLPYVDRWFFATVLYGIASTLTAAGYDAALYNLQGENFRESVLTDFLLRKRLDAAAVVSLRLTPGETEQLFSAGIPLVGIGGSLEGAPTISVDDLNAGLRATNHLIQLGHCRIAFIGGPPEADRSFPMSSDRRRGFERAMSAAGLPIHERDQLVSDFTFLGAYQQVKNLLAEPEQRPTAVFAATDEMAAGAILAARDLGLEVPRDLSVIGIDAHPLGEAFGLTTIDQQAHHQGTRAAQLLLRQLSGEPVTAGHELHRAHFIARSSTVPPGSNSSPA